MATVTYIKKSRQNISAMRVVMNYCQREDKTIDTQEEFNEFLARMDAEYGYREEQQMI